MATILPTLGGNQSWIIDINADGVMVGLSATSAGEIHAVRWDNSGLTDLTPDLRGFSVAVAVNSSGQIVGANFTDSPSSHSALLWKNGTMTNLGSWTPHDINSQGTIVGTGGESGHAVVWDPSTASVIDLGWCLDDPDHPSEAHVINSSGLIAGLCEDDLGFNRAVLSFGEHTLDLGTLGKGRSASALGINSSGEVVGWSEAEVDGVFQAFRWKNGRMSRLDRPKSGASAATGISDNGDVVGESEVSDGVRHAVLWSGPSKIDLDPGGSPFSSSATAITASGDRIVGWSSAENGQQLPTLWTRQ